MESESKTPCYYYIDSSFVKIPTISEDAPQQQQPHQQIVAYQNPNTGTVVPKKDLSYASSSIVHLPLNLQPPFYSRPSFYEKQARFVDRFETNDARDLQFIPRCSNTLPPKLKTYSGHKEGHIKRTHSNKISSITSSSRDETFSVEDLGANSQLRLFPAMECGGSRSKIWNPCLVIVIASLLLLIGAAVVGSITAGAIVQIRQWTVVNTNEDPSSSSVVTYK